MPELPLINENAFVDAVNTLQTMYDEETKILDTLNIEPEWLCGEWIYSYFKLIKNLIEPYDESDWLGYFCYELEFGKKWKEGTITNVIDKSDIKLQTAEDLYNIIKEQAENAGDFTISVDKSNVKDDDKFVLSPKAIAAISLSEVTGENFNDIWEADYFNQFWDVFCYTMKKHGYITE